MGNMKKKIAVFALLAVGVLWVGCDDSDGDKDTTISTDTNLTPDAGVTTDTVVSSSGDTGSSGVATESDEPFVHVPTVAINETFDNWTQDDLGFYMAKPDQMEYNDAIAAGTDPGTVIYDDNATKVSLDGHEAIMLHANAVDNDGFGFAIEGQWALDQEQIDMSSEEFQISFDLYVPSSVANESKNANVQFGLYETANYTPIYSKWWSGSIIADEWVTITGQIDTTTGDIDYSGFSSDPDEWIFDVVRVQVIINGDGAAEGDEITFYLDNLKVDNLYEGETVPTDTEAVVTPDGGVDTGETTADGGVDSETVDTAADASVSADGGLDAGL